MAPPNGLIISLVIVINLRQVAHKLFRYAIATQAQKKEAINN